MCLLSLCRSLTIEMLIGSYSGDDRVKRCRKGTFFLFSAAHAAHQAGAPSAVQQAPVKSPFSASHAAQEASAYSAARQASHSSVWS